MMSGMYLQSRNAYDSSDHVVKIADPLGCLGCGVHTGRKNRRRRNIVKIPYSYDSYDKWEPGFTVVHSVTVFQTEVVTTTKQLVGKI